MNKEITERLELLRREMASEKIDAVIIPTTDPHNSEYPAPYWESRKWISGFTGSAGTVVVTSDDAALWTDSRYFLQAAEQLEGTGIRLMKLKMPETPTVLDWVKQKVISRDGSYVSVDGTTMSYSEVKEMETELRRSYGITLRTNYDPMKRIWKDRPEIPHGDIFPVDRSIMGETIHSKLSRIREKMRENRCSAFVTTDLMEIAWTLNLRGSDVAMTPVFVANLFVRTDGKASGTVAISGKAQGTVATCGKAQGTVATCGKAQGTVAGDVVLFCNGKLTQEALDALAQENVTVKKYAEFIPFLRNCSDDRIMCDKKATCYSVYNAIKDKAVDMESPVAMMKAVKNEKEIEGFHEAMRRDGVAMVRFLRWLNPAVEAGGQTEISVSDKLASLRAEQPGFRELSFETICGYAEHGAIVHYEATPETDAPLKPEGFLLLDSGGHYNGGTTDITRTIALGPVTDYMKKVYTLVLRANIDLAMAKFPEGTAGTQLDVLARGVLWQEGLHYWHGTGHGVGSYLAVHEGPHQFRMEWMPAPFLEHMTVTDEPGVYLDGRFGVRTENTMLIVKDRDTEFGKFLKFESLTLCPIDTTPIIVDMLSPQELEWLNMYHDRVRRELMPLLDDEADKAWLMKATEAICC